MCFSSSGIHTQLRWGWIAICTVATALPACTHPPGSQVDAKSESASTLDRLQAFKEATPAQYGIGDDPALTTFLFEIEGGSDLDLVDVVSREFEWSSETAEFAIEGSIERALAWSERVTKDSTSRNSVAEAALWAALERSPRSWPLHEELADFYDENFEQCNEDGLQRIADHWGDIREFVSRTGSIVQQCPRLAVNALQTYPEDLGVLRAVILGFDRKFSSTWPISLAARHYATEIARANGDDLSSVRDGIFSSYLESLLLAGAVDAALEFYDSMSPLIQRNILRADPEDVSRPDQEIEGSPQQAIAFELTAALLLRGRFDHARAIIPAPREPEESLDPPKTVDTASRRRHYSSGQQHCRRILQATLNGVPGDPFRLLIEVSGLEAFSSRGNKCVHSATWRSLLIRMAKDAGYSSIARSIESRRDSPLSQSTFEYFEENYAAVLQALPPGLAASYEKIESELRIASTEASQNPGAPASTSRLMKRILQPAPDVFIERPLPKDIPPQPSLQEEADKWMAKWDESDEIADDSLSDAVREERDGNRVLRISANQTYDPMGEVGFGGYWLKISDDGGESWEKPLYTGLRNRLPYVVRNQSHLPLLKEGRIQIEVAIDEVEVESVTFPPIGMTSRIQREGIFVAATLDDLKRDSDGDGLTDLAEHALLLDPDSRDSDQDGLSDGEDNLPHVPRGFGSQDRAEALAAALPAMFGAGLRANVVSSVPSSGSEASQLRAAMGTPVSEGDEWNLFLVGDRGDFESLDTSQRVVVLTPDEAEAVRQQRGIFYPARIVLFELDEAQENGILVWSASWTGGTIRLRKLDGKWSAEVTGNWIT